MKNSYLIFLSGLSMLYACHSPETANKKINSNDTIPVKVVELRQHVGDNSIAVSGQFTTDNETMLSFKTSGIVSTISVKEGDAVKKGQLLASLNPTEINAQLQQAQLNNEKAERDYARTSNLYKDSVATLEQLQNSKTSLLLARQQLSAVRFNHQYSEIHASQDGYVLKKLANAGQQIAAGSAVIEINGIQQGKWILKVGISDQEWAAIQNGYKAKIQTSAMPGQILEGIVTRKSEGVDAASGTFSADITLTGRAPRAIASGMFGKAIITTPGNINSSHTWKVPYEALLDGDGDNGYVFITNDNKTAHKVKVTVSGIDKNVATISSGLEDAQGLIISGSAYLTDNSSITIQDPIKSKQ